MSWSASYSGRRYGFTFSARSPGRKPSFSPASTAGRAMMMRFTFFCMSDAAAMAMARYVLPVPAGPMPKIKSWVRMASTYSRCARLLGKIGRLRAVTMMVSSSSSVSERAGSARRPRMELATSFGPMSKPLPTSAAASRRKRSASLTSSAAPATRIVLPRRLTSAPLSRATSVSRLDCGPESARRTWVFATSMEEEVGAASIL